jgi:hypothetical protein
MYGRRMLPAIQDERWRCRNRRKDGKRELTKLLGL